MSISVDTHPWTVLILISSTVWAGLARLELDRLRLPTGHDGLDAEQRALYELLLSEAARYLIELSGELPLFTQASFGKLLTGNRVITEMLTRLIEDTRRIQLKLIGGNVVKDFSADRRG